MFYCSGLVLLNELVLATRAVKKSPKVHQESNHVVVEQVYALRELEDVR